MKVNENEYIIGWDIADAVNNLESYGYTVRVVREDGKWYAITDDFIPERIDVEVENGIVTKVW
jgi:hypothetical protein